MRHKFLYSIGSCLREINFLRSSCQTLNSCSLKEGDIEKCLASLALEALDRMDIVAARRYVMAAKQLREGKA